MNITSAFLMMLAQSQTSIGTPPGPVARIEDCARYFIVARKGAESECTARTEQDGAITYTLDTRYKDGAHGQDQVTVDRNGTSRNARSYFIPAPLPLPRP